MCDFYIVEYSGGVNDEYFYENSYYTAKESAEEYFQIMLARAEEDHKKNDVPGYSCEIDKIRLYKARPDDNNCIVADGLPIMAKRWDYKTKQWKDEIRGGE